MILDLTIENLLKSGCNEAEANELFNSTGGDYRWTNITCFVSKLENKFYTEIDYQRKTYFGSGNIVFPIDYPDLIPEFFDLFLNSFLEKQKKLLKSMFVEADQKAIFISRQIVAVKKEIDKNKVELLKYPQLDIYHKIESIYNAYLKLLEQPEQLETNKKVSDLIQGNNTETKTPINVIALWYWYNGNSITRDNADTIALKYKYTAKTSGEGLYQDYVKYSNNTDRLASGETKIKLKNKIELFKIVRDLLINENAKAKANTELDVLKSKLHKFKK